MLVSNLQLRASSIGDAARWCRDVRLNHRFQISVDFGKIEVMWNRGKLR